MQALQEDFWGETSPEKAYPEVGIPGLAWLPLSPDQPAGKATWLCVLKGHTGSQLEPYCLLALCV